MSSPHSKAASAVTVFASTSSPAASITARSFPTDPPNPSPPKTPSSATSHSPTPPHHLPTSREGLGRIPQRIPHRPNRSPQTQNQRLQHPHPQPHPTAPAIVIGRTNRHRAQPARTRRSLSSPTLPPRRRRPKQLHRPRRHQNPIHPLRINPPGQFTIIREPHILYIATSNPGKLRDFAAAATPNITLTPLPGLKEIPAPPEDEPTFEGNARLKALYYSRQAPGQIIIADDSGLEVDALHGAPGVRSARYAEDQHFEAQPKPRPTSATTAASSKP